MQANSRSFAMLRMTRPRERSWTGWRGFCWAENVGIGTGFEDGGFAGGEFDATGV